MYFSKLTSNQVFPTSTHLLLPKPLDWVKVSHQVFSKTLFLFLRTKLSLCDYTLIRVMASLCLPLDYERKTVYIGRTQENLWNILNSSTYSTRYLTCTTSCSHCSRSWTTARCSCGPSFILAIFTNTHKNFDDLRITQYSVVHRNLCLFISSCLSTPQIIMNKRH